jgi:hypothetical protein
MHILLAFTFLHIEYTEAFLDNVVPTINFHVCPIVIHITYIL